MLILFMSPTARSGSLCSLAFTLCAFLIYKQHRPGRWETWVCRMALTGYVLACAGVFLHYWTQWTGTYNVLFRVGWMVTVPGLLLTMMGSTVLGITLLIVSPNINRPVHLPLSLNAGFETDWSDGYTSSSAQVHAPTLRALATAVTKVLTKARTGTVTERGRHALGSNI